MHYRGIIIKESLKDPGILSTVETLSKHTVGEGGKVWHMHKVKVREEDIEAFTDSLSHALDPKGMWYAHFYNEDPGDDLLYVVFADNVFLVKKDDPHVAVEYGLSLQIPYEQLDFKPLSIQDESW